MTNTSSRRAALTGSHDASVVLPAFVHRTDSPGEAKPILPSTPPMYCWHVQADSDDFAVNVSADYDDDGSPDENFATLRPGSVLLMATLLGYGPDCEIAVTLPASRAEAFARTLLAVVEEAKRAHPETWTEAAAAEG